MPFVAKFVLECHMTSHCLLPVHLVLAHILDDSFFSSSAIQRFSEILPASLDSSLIGYKLLAVEASMGYSSYSIRDNSEKRGVISLLDFMSLYLGRDTLYGGNMIS